MKNTDALIWGVSIGFFCCAIGNQLAKEFKLTEKTICSSSKEISLGGLNSKDQHKANAIGTPKLD